MKEANYANRVKSSYLSGNITSELKNSEEETASVPELEEICGETRISMLSSRVMIRMRYCYASTTKCRRLNAW